MPAKLSGKYVSDSVLNNQKHAVRPEHLNKRGTVFGGYVLSLIDMTAAMVAWRHAGKPCVTASIDSVHFISPIYLNDHIVLNAAINRAWETSMEIGVKVFAENPSTGEKRQVASAYVTFVALNEDNRPTMVPPVIPRTTLERRRYREANRRRAIRLELKKLVCVAS